MESGCDDPNQKSRETHCMYAKKYVMGLKLPEYNKQIGYDLMIGDWVGPYGKGINSDILFTENHADEKSGYTFTIGFPKEATAPRIYIAG